MTFFVTSSFSALFRNTDYKVEMFCPGTYTWIPYFLNEHIPRLPVSFEWEYNSQIDNNGYYTKAIRSMYQCLIFEGLDL